MRYLDTCDNQAIIVENYERIEYRANNIICTVFTDNFKATANEEGARNGYFV